MKTKINTTDNISLLRSNSISTIVRDQLEQDIITGVLSGGTHVSEMTIANTFSVSRGPVREALRTLEGQGLLEQRKNCGWFVRSLSSDEIKDIFIFREILDNGLSFLLTKNIEQSKFQDYLSELDGLIDAMDKAIIKEDQVKFAILNQKFHDTLIMLSGNARLQQAYRRIMGELASHVTESLKAEGTMLASNLDHKTIIQSIRNKDFLTMTRCLKEHNEKTKSRMTLE